MTSHKKQRRHSGPRRKGISTPQILVVVGVAILAVALLVILNMQRSRTAAVNALTYETGVTPEGEPYKGSPDAPLKLVEYSDFLCSHCANLADALNTLSPDYIETGKVQVIFRNFAFLAPESTQAAQAAECALDQGADKFWHYHDLLFANQGRGLAAYSNTQLEVYARQIGLNVASFKNCLDTGAKAAKVKADLDAGTGQGVTGTPTWFLNGQMESGEMPPDELRRLFDSKLSQGS
jgi:protein-disulfide isomerase